MNNMKPVHEALTLGVAAPCVTFALLIFLWTYEYEARPFLVYFFFLFVLVFCAFLRTFRADTLIRKDGVLLERDGGPSTAPFQNASRNKAWSIWNLVVAIVGTWLGRSNFQTNRLPFLLTRDGAVYNNVTPLDKTVDKPDAAIVHFNAKTTTLDVGLFRAYRHKGQNYCVAPLSARTKGTGENLVARFFAVGVDCCGSSFVDCLAYSSEGTLTEENINKEEVPKAGVVVPQIDFPAQDDRPLSGTSEELAFSYSGSGWGDNTRSELSLLFDPQTTMAETTFYNKAARSCAAYYGLKLGQNPIFLHLTRDAEKFQRGRDTSTFGMCILSIGLGWPSILLGGIVITNIYSRRQRASQ
ncbi:unnamed protein product [Amoebophrya sp. A25]|nr:unnamed protein product [Amoebophrya sp. A25]|eukprot:GSA25T00001066001.1